MYGKYSKNKHGLLIRLLQGARKAGRCNQTKVLSPDDMALSFQRSSTHVGCMLLQAVKTSTCRGYREQILTLV